MLVGGTQIKAQALKFANQMQIKVLLVLLSHIQIPTRIPEKIVVALFSGILVDYTVVLLKL